MKLDHAVIDQLRVRPGRPAALSDRDTAGVAAKSDDARKLRLGGADDELQGFTAELAALQEQLYAGNTHALLVILQGLDAAGKDGTIKHVMSGVNPQGCVVTSFKQPSATDLDHDFLWRAAQAIPGSGRIGIFNRSHYEDVLVVRVHPDLLASQHLPGDPGPTPELWKGRYDDINAFEHHLDRNGIRIVKLFLHISKDEQKKRLLERLDDPTKHWKFSSSDLAERDYWDDYQVAYEEALSATSTAWAPWYVIPGDHKHVMRALVAGLLVDAIDGLHLSLPAVTPAQLAEIEAAKAKLRAS
jgi:PPK2 family polyphosphate:nucleotide phosphotransferase